MNLNKIAKNIRNILENKKKELQLSFIEKNHVYFMKDKDGQLRTDFPSVSKLLEHFYEPFPAHEVAFKKANGDQAEMQILLDQWSAIGTYATNIGSRVHYILEKNLIQQYGNYKQVRKPLFEMDIEQEIKSDSMIKAGDNFLVLMKERGAVLLDTEVVLGDPELGYTGQPDKVWLIQNREKTDYGLIVTDWKTNKPKNFKINQWTKPMKAPFAKQPDNKLSHYYLQLSFYAKLLLKMLEDTKYENLKLLGCIVVLVKDNSDFEEFRVPKEIITKVINMDMDIYLKK